VIEEAFFETLNCWQGSVIYFFQYQNSLKKVCFEEKFTTTSTKSKKEEEKRPESKNLFDLFDLFDFAVKILLF
jgi:hypothetical protein